MALVRSAALDLLDPVVRQIYFNQYKRISEERLFSQVFNILTSKLRREIDSGFSGFGKFAQKTEAAPITFADPAQGYDYTYTHASWALGFEVSREMADDDQHRIITRMPGALASSAVYTQELEAWAIFNNAFAAGTTYGDGKRLCATDHPLEGSGGTASNRLSADSDLSVSSLKTALTLMRNTVDSQNVPVRLKPEWLIVAPDEEFTALELLKSIGLPATADNNINSIRVARPNLKPMVVEFLTDTDAWFLVAEKAQHALNWFWRTKPEMGSTTDPKTLSRLHSCFMRFSVGASGWRGVVGTPGA